MRLIATTVDDMRPARLYAIDSEGTVHAPPTQYLGVGPFAQIVMIKNVMTGPWTVVLADGEQVFACERFGVWKSVATPSPEEPPEKPSVATSPPVELSEKTVAWETRVRWETDTENFYAAFIEQLFSHPVDDMRTWKYLSKLLRDPKRNLLYNHLGLDEDRLLSFEPDCADLPYFLRGYFAFKLRLPFGYRSCSRPKQGRNMWCGDLHTNEESSPCSKKTRRARWSKSRVPGRLGERKWILPFPTRWS